MIHRTTNLAPAARAGFDVIIDVRSPAEFALDHIPGAINLPVLDDAQRAEVGTEYVQGSKFLARRTGAALVARNIAIHLEDALKDRDGSFRPLVHCWRGGQRSGAMATVMDQVGWTVTVLDGGYRTWRRAVVARLYDQPWTGPIVLIDGGTGTGKTEVLNRLSARGVQTVDLEGLARHRGSLFGALPGGQPGQKLFESRLFAALDALDPTQPLVLEAESSKVGARTIPPALWAAMATAPRLEITAPVTARAGHIVSVYGQIAADPAALDTALARLPRHHAKATITRWREMAAARQIEALATELIVEHYDPAYRRAGQGPGLGTVSLTNLSDPELDRAAEAVAAAVSNL